MDAAAPRVRRSTAELAEPATYHHAVTTRDGVWTPSDPAPHPAAALSAEPPPAAPSPIARARLRVH